MEISEKNEKPEYSKDGAEWSAIFWQRFARHLDELRWLYMELYNNGSMFDELCGQMEQYYKMRSANLKRSDREREENPDWYRQNDRLGMMLYIDNFAGNLRGVEEKLDYVEECGVNYLHLMPFLDTPEGKSDGGYAVADFRKVREDLGTMEDLEHLTEACHKRDISVCMDFVMNHTSEEHEWARRARAGEGEYMSRYFFFDNPRIPEEFERTVPQVFPTTAPGNFTWIPEIGHYVMTTFYPYQWDLNYRNPRVFNEMMYNFLYLANRGIDIIRIDAVPYIWKELGTSCRNLRQVHTIVRMMRMISEIVCPGILLLGEVVMEPEKVAPYFGTVEKPECHMLYNVTTMATIWNTVATRDVRLLKKQFEIVSALPKQYTFQNYLRCHDDIGWGLDYDFLARQGMEERAHKQYLNDYFLGKAGASNSRGELYNADPVTGDARFCGTTASMCGIEKAAYEAGTAEAVRTASRADAAEAIEGSSGADAAEGRNGGSGEDIAEIMKGGSGADAAEEMKIGFGADAAAMEKAIQLDVMLHAYMFMQSGIPVLYSGDEIGQLNDYSYKEDPKKAPDSRYIHRGAMDWKRAENIADPNCVEGKLFRRLKELEAVRKQEKAFVACADTWSIETGDTSVIAIGRYYDGEKVLGLFNFSESDKTAWINETDSLYIDLLSGKTREIKATPSCVLTAGGACEDGNTTAGIDIPAYGFYYLKKL